jgi:hypothetical protein
MRHNEYDELAARAMLDAEPEEKALVKPPVEMAGKLRRITVPFVRVPLAWIADERFRLEPRSRVLLWLLHRSRWGQRKVEFTAADAEKLGMSRWTKNRQIRQLEATGTIRAERLGRRSPAITVRLPE